MTEQHKYLTFSASLREKSTDEFRLNRGECGADGRGIRVDPLEGKGSALVRLDRIDETEIVGGKVDARPVGAAFEHEALAVGCDFGLALYEVALAHAEKRGNAGDLRLGYANDAVLDAATRPAATTAEIIFASYHSATEPSA